MNFKLVEKYLYKFQKPGRYIGNEIGIPNKDFINTKIRCLISYPDIYEIGMSNQGIKIIYDRINSLEFASCERVFSPWVDFEKFLIENDLPLFSLETKSPVNNFDVFSISIQYELLFTNFLNLLKLSKIPILKKNRKDEHPIILCGGPVITNPIPFIPFADIFFIGEAECRIEEFIEKLSECKNNKITKIETLKILSTIPGFFLPEYSKEFPVNRQIYKNFHNDPGLKNYLIPNINIIQNKLVIEIMRGCPNKCRFCQAGIIYKPYREKNLNTIINNVNTGILNLGINEVTFSSLSSGDYSEIINLTNYFNELFNKKNISFSLPSIKVESFDINLLKKISTVRKSGLTFAIESGSREGQQSINKIVLFEKIEEIVNYAFQNGWKLIKLYFMIGLPHQKEEINYIIQFLDKILNINKKIKINLNIAVFVPKPHTPYQYEKQLNLEESIFNFNIIENHFKKSRVKVKKHNSYMSYIEGFIARGDEKIGYAVYEAFKNGSKFDGWEEFFNFDNYKNAFDKYNIKYDDYLSKKDINTIFPWSNINVGITDKYLHEELNKSEKHILSNNCKIECDKNCNICSKDLKSNEADKETSIIEVKNTSNYILKNIENKKTRYLLEFSKLGLLRFIGHIDLIKYFEKIFLRSNFPIIYTQGYNPKPKMQFSSALSLGIESNCELLEFYSEYNFDPSEILKSIQIFQHNSIPINKIKKLEIKNKISIFNNIDYYEYQLFYDPNDKPIIENITKNYVNNLIEYQIIKKNKITTGNYQDFLSINKICSDNIICRIKKVSPLPKIMETIENIFNNRIFLIKKTKMLKFYNNNFINLFDYFK